MARVPLVDKLHTYFPFGFHLSRQAWEWFDIAGLVNVARSRGAFSEVYAIRRLAERFNERLYRRGHAAPYLDAGQLISAGTIVDVLRFILDLYLYEQVPKSLGLGLETTRIQMGETTVEQPPPAFVRLFPPRSVMAGDRTETDYLAGSTEDASNREVATTEMILLYLSVCNPAFRPLQDLFEDVDLRRQSPYLPLVENLERFFEGQPPFEPVNLPLFRTLRAPMEASPDSIDGQLAYIRQHWAEFLPQELMERVLLATDVLREETLLRGIGPGPQEALRFDAGVYGYDNLYDEPAAFSRDADWMSNAVIIAKSTLVWLDQLSRKYERPIHTLSEIPDEELDQLSRWGFNGLWLIGVWERSVASETIKRVCGNPEAAASAYSVYDYVIANELGGQPAYENLRDRAWHRGIRLASDMVPNHMGIHSRWVVEHPDWFIQSGHPPFPGYQFTGMDLSPDERVTVQIEDGYWDRRDASVVFKRIDQWTGDVRYIYHGNDGTSMPWNDTAQLNFLIPEVREAVIQTILHVARQFPIIRFDAAMTLAKKHYQRLWFPQPGDGGAIPSRAEHGMTRRDFDQVFPKEFWREVVDRIAAEVPETLLLAEAFWLMEGYFVRTLGMHRVYNSAFMNMLKMEDNAKYRQTIKNVLEFSPEVLKRFVNFMNNPDEQTAVAQFGKGDKYFGVAVMMVTMPGLPMFGHGQIEGFTEKYGMEYRKAYWDEHVDHEMVRRHEREVFPLMQRRYLFSGAENFALFDFVTSEGWVDENVFAFTNRNHDQRAVILYNNAYSTTQGRLQTSTAINAGGGDSQYLVRRSLAEALGLNTAPNVFYCFRDHQSGLEYLRSGERLAQEGLFAELRGYQYHAFLDFREVYDEDGSWAELSSRLNGSGVPSVHEARREMRFQPLLEPFRHVFDVQVFSGLLKDEAAAGKTFMERVEKLLKCTSAMTGSTRSTDVFLKDVASVLKQLGPACTSRRLSASLLREFRAEVCPKGAAPLEHVIIASAIMRQLQKLAPSEDNDELARILADPANDGLLPRVVEASFSALNGHNGRAYAEAQLAAVLAVNDRLLEPEPDESVGDKLRELLDDPAAAKYLQINEHEGVRWLVKEPLEELTRASVYLAAVRQLSSPKPDAAALKDVLNTGRFITDGAARAGYRLEKTLELLSTV